MKNKIIIIGAGGHGKVLLDAIHAIGTFNVVGYVDSALPVGRVVMNNVKVISTQDDFSSLQEKADYFIVAIGNNKIRKELTAIAKKYLKPATIIHPSAIIGSGVKIGAGSVVLENVVIHADTKIGENVIVNAAVVIDHDCTIGNNVHLSVGTKIGSTTTIADEVTTSVGQNINSFSKIS